MELICAVQHYHWGKKGNNSLAGRFASANSGISVDENKPFAEFWMGTHPNGPSYIKPTKTLLLHHLILHSYELGSKVTKLFGNQLPFLFKILSIEEPLSIQAHPTKSHAEELFQKFPQIYKDGNHKPELAIALTKFEALCGFRPLIEIKHFLENIPEFRMLIGSDKVEKFCRCNERKEKYVGLMKDCFQSLMSCEEQVVASALGNPQEYFNLIIKIYELRGLPGDKFSKQDYAVIEKNFFISEKLIARFENFSISEKEQYLVSLVQRINLLFPKDIGVFCVYWLNYIALSPGEALYLAPNEPHAYLYGDCLECMANSDNVVRAGLTPKFRDIQTLCEMLSYKNYEPSEIIFYSKMEDEFCQIYSPPVKDFAVTKITLPKNIKYNLKKRESASILLVIEGCGRLNSVTLEFGKVFFIPSMTEYCVDSDGLILYQAFCNI